MTIWNHIIIFIMNLWGRIKIGLIVLLALFFEACEEPNEIGLELKGDPDKIGAFYQKIELNTTLINNDSLFTLSVIRLMAGETYNGEFGAMTATGYSQFGLSRELLDIPESATYDSLILDIKNDYSFGTGVVSDQRYTVHELTEDLDDTAAYFSFSSAEYDPTPLSTGDFLLPERDDTVFTFRIDDSYGLRLFEAVKDTNIIDPGDVNSLQELFKGFAFVSDVNNNSLMGINVINDSTKLRLYYSHDDSTFRYSFTFAGVANFNQIETDRTGSPLQGLNDLFYQEFQPDNDKAYIQSGADVITKIDFTPMLDFFDTIDYATINQTIIDIIIDEPGENELPPSNVLFYYHDESNKRIRFGSEYIGIVAEGTSDLLRAFYNEDESRYEAAITIFTDNLLKGISSDTTVLMYPPEFGITNTANQLLVSPGKMVLEIYYSKVK